MWQFMQLVLKLVKYRFDTPDRQRYIWYLNYLLRENEDIAIQNRLARLSVLDKEYILPEDVPLTEEEIAAIDKFWSKYSFAYPKIAYGIFQGYKNRSGILDPRFCPPHIKANIFHKLFNNKNYSEPFENKAMLDYIYPDIAHPDNVLKKMNGLYLDANCHIVSKEEAAEAVLSYIKEKNNKGVVFKINGSFGGRGVSFLDMEDATLECIAEKLDELEHDDFVVQGVVEQSSFFKQFSAKSVNTLRLTTLIIDNDVKVLAAFVRCAWGDARVDNISSGGAVVGVDKESGRLNNWALKADMSRTAILSNGFDLAKQELYVPNFDKTVDIVKHSHCRVPYVRLISWDLAFDVNNVPLLLECNFGGDIRAHESVTGPMFGDLLDKIADKYLLEDFYRLFMWQDYICEEFADHIVIEKYVGIAKSVVVPAMLRKKPVTELLPTAFKSTSVKTVNVTQKLADRAAIALEGLEIKVREG